MYAYNYIWPAHSALAELINSYSFKIACCPAIFAIYAKVLKGSLIEYSKKQQLRQVYIVTLRRFVGPSGDYNGQIFQTNKTDVQR